MKTAIITIILAMAIFSTNSFAAKRGKLDISEKAVKSNIILECANDYLDVKIKRIYNAKIDRKSVVTTRFGVIVTSYVVTADLDVEKYGKIKGLFYVYTGQAAHGEHYNAPELYLAAYGNPEHEKGYQKTLIEFRKMVKENVAVTITSLKLMTAN